MNGGSIPYHAMLSRRARGHIELTALHQAIYHISYDVEASHVSIHHGPPGSSKLYIPHKTCRKEALMCQSIPYQLIPLPLSMICHIDKVVEGRLIYTMPLCASQVGTDKAVTCPLTLYNQVCDPYSQ